MLKEFIEHIQKTTQPIIQQIGSSTFVVTGSGNVTEIRPAIYHPDTLILHSLEALVKMVQTEAANMATPLYITIPDYLTVRCFGQPNPDARYFRQVYYEAKATDVPGFRDGFREQEKQSSNCGAGSPPARAWTTCWTSSPVSARRMA